MNDPYSGGGSSLNTTQGEEDGGATTSGIADVVYTITKQISNTLTGRITVVGIDALGRTITVGNPFKLFVKSKKTYQELTQCKGGGQKWVIEAPQSRLAPINAQYNNPPISYIENRTVPCPVLPSWAPAGTECHAKIQVKDTAYFYFATPNGGACNIPGGIKKPIVFLDGFDPTNTRDIKKIYEDYINVLVTRNNVSTPFGDYMLNQGYDFIILDFKHGNDLLERNAMTVVSLIEQLNQVYGSTMQQGITLIGPSMGSLIAQYALSYMEKNNIPHNVKTYISFDGPHQGANLPIGLQNFIEYISKRGTLSKISSTKSLIREGLYNGLAARQMLAHHTSTNAQFPTPDPLRTKFLQNLTAVGEYPTLCRKVAIIDGSNLGTINPNHPVAGDLMLDIYMKRKRFFSLCDNNICKAFDWSFSGAPSAGTARVSDMWTASPLLNLLIGAPLGRTSTYGQAAWSNSSLDNAPGSLFAPLITGTTDEQKAKQSDLQFWLQEILYLLTGSKRSGLYYNIEQFTFMPSYHSADLRFPTKNLYLKWDNQYLCGKTPFDYVYAQDVSVEHVKVTPPIAQAFENEVRYSISDLPQLSSQITGANPLCTSTSTYSINFCKPANATVSWLITPSGIVTPTSGTGNSITLNKVSTGSINISATISYPNGIMSTVQNSTVTVGSPPVSSLTATRVGSTCYYDATATVSSSVRSVEFSQDNSTWTAAATQVKSTYYAGYNFVGPANQAVYARANNSCGTSTVKYAYLSIPSPPFQCSYYRMQTMQSIHKPTSMADLVQSSEKISMYPNPAKGNVVISLYGGNSSTSPDKIYAIKITNVLGQIQKSFVYKTGIKTIDIQLLDLSPGIYFVSVFDGKEWNNQSLLVQH